MNPIVVSNEIGELIYKTSGNKVTCDFCQDPILKDQHFRENYAGFPIVHEKCYVEKNISKCVLCGHRVLENGSYTITLGNLSYHQECLVSRVLVSPMPLNFNYPLPRIYSEKENTYVNS